jgi:hypothetical protein
MGMEPNIEFNPSAFRHGVSETDIRHAILFACYDSPAEGEENKNLCLGFDTQGFPLEVLYNDVGDDEIYVFHAMKCRKMFFHLFTKE